MPSVNIWIIDFIFFHYSWKCHSRESLSVEHQKQGGISLEDLRRMSHQGHFKVKLVLKSGSCQGHFKVNVISRSRLFQGQGHTSNQCRGKVLYYWYSYIFVVLPVLEICQTCVWKLSGICWKNVSDNSQNSEFSFKNVSENCLAVKKYVSNKCQKKCLKSARLQETVNSSDKFLIHYLCPIWGKPSE